MRTAPEPSRPDEAPPMRRPERRWLPVFAVVAIIAFITGAGGLIAGGWAVAPAPSVEVGPAVLVRPEPGWEAELREDDGDEHAAVFARGAAVLSVLAAPADGATPADLLAAYEADVLGARLADLSLGTPEPASIGGSPAARVGYVGTTVGGTAIEGFLAAFVTPSGQGVVFDAAAPQGDLASAVGDLAVMIEGAEVR